MPKLRICHTGFNYFPGQGLTIFHEFARHEARNGMDVVAIAPGRPGEPTLEKLDGVEIHRIPLGSVGRFSFDRLSFLVQASRLIGAQDFDVIHVYAFVGAGILPLISRSGKARWLYDCQTSAIKPPLLGLQNRLIRLESRPFDAITVLSEGIREIVFKPADRVVAIVPLGADLDRFAPRPADPGLRHRLRIADADVVLTYCGTLDHNRRMDKLIDAFEFTALQDPSAKLLIIGNGSALDDLRDQASRLGLSDRIVFTGLVPYHDVPAYLAITDIALAFIRMDERFEHQPPTKTVEYLAQGLPVVATDTAGNRQFVRHDFNGIVCGGTASEYGQAMLDLVRDNDRRLRLAATARDSVTGFDWSAIVRAHVLPVYRKILGNQ